jgi:hypothetical protein
LISIWQTPKHNLSIIKPMFAYFKAEKDFGIMCIQYRSVIKQRSETWHSQCEGFTECSVVSISLILKYTR